MLGGMSEKDIRRSLANHAPLRRRPATMLRRMLDWLPEDTELFGDAAPVARLERRLAEILGTPAALFFPSGTMAQQVALRVHAERTGRRAFVAHPQNHLDLWEEHGYAAVHGLRFVAAGDRHEVLTLDALRSGLDARRSDRRAVRRSEVRAVGRSTSAPQ